MVYAKSNWCTSEGSAESAAIEIDKINRRGNVTGMQIAGSLSHIVSLSRPSVARECVIQTDVKNSDKTKHR